MVRRKKQKGAFQLSLGFIIGLIFAVILLVLSIMWIRGSFVQITDMSDTMIQNGQNEILTTFNQEKTGFSVHPTEYKGDPGVRIGFAVGVKNNAVDGKEHYFGVHIEIATAEKDAISSFCGNDGETLCDEFRSEINSWLIYDKSVSLVKANDHRTWPIKIKIPENAPKGIYMFTAESCKAENKLTSCLESGADSWETPVTFVMEVK